MNDAGDQGDDAPRMRTQGHMRVHAVPVREPDGTIREWVGAETDVTEERWGEERQRFPAEASAVLSSSLDYRATLRNVTRLAVPWVADQCSVDLIEEDRTIVHAAVAYADGRRDSLCSGSASPAADPLVALSDDVARCFGIAASFVFAAASAPFSPTRPCGTPAVYDSAGSAARMACTSSTV